MPRMLDFATFSFINVEISYIRPELVDTCGLPRLVLLNSPPLRHLPGTGMVATAQRIWFKASFYNSLHNRVDVVLERKDYPW
jgi:hypothetical protein